MTIPDAGVHMHLSMPRSELITLSPAGHMSVFEQGEALVKQSKVSRRIYSYPASASRRSESITFVP